MIANKSFKTFTNLLKSKTSIMSGKKLNYNNGINGMGLIFFRTLHCRISKTNVKKANLAAIATN